MFKFCVTTILLLFASLASLGQCDLNMPNPDSICTYNEGVPLGGGFGDGGLEYSWTPNEGLSQTNIPNPIAKPNKTQTYKITAKIPIGKELVTNGDFNKGNTDFTSQYIFLQNPSASSGNFTEGKYIIDKSPEGKHSCFATCTDYASGKGNMMMVNGTGTPSTIVWEQTISVDTNTKYSFSTFAQNISCGSGSPAILQFSINDSLIGPTFKASNTLCLWKRFHCLWDSKNNTSAKISIVNQSTSANGNDFALDSISFREYCIATDEVTVVVNVDNVFKHLEICTGDSILLNGVYYKTKRILKYKLLNKKGCDSLVTVDLSIKPAIRTYPYVLKCEGDSLFLQKKYRKFSGRYTDTLKTSLGCDSITKTFLQFIIRKYETVESSPCYGTSFYFRNKVYKNKGTYYDTIYNQQCIDVLTKIIVTPHPERKLVLPIEHFCKGDSLPYKNTFITKDTTINDSLYATNTGCDSLVIYQYKTFDNYFNVDSIALFCGDTPVKFDAGGNYIAYQWSNGITNKIIETKEEGTYIISVIDSNQCLMHDTVYFIERCKPIFFVPNAFTINGDGLNDYFSVYTKNVTAIKFMIFDRWGEVLFKTDKVDFVWTGTFKGKALPEGLYQWVGTFEGYNLEGQVLTENRKGYIQLLR